MGASASLVNAGIEFSDTTVTDNEAIIRQWEGVDYEKFEILKEAYEGVKMESREVILQKLNEVRTCYLLYITRQQELH
jgi:hypothetical protein